MYVRVEVSRHYRKRIRSAGLGKWWGWIPWFLLSLLLVMEIVNSPFFEIAIGFDSNGLSWFSHFVARDARGIRARSKKMRGIRFFWTTLSKKACDTDYPPNTLAKGKYPYFFPVCVFRFFLLSVSDPTHVFPRGMDQEPLPANPDGRRLVV